MTSTQEWESLKTKAELINAIKKAKSIFVNIGYGAIEHSVKITKREAKMIAAKIGRDSKPSDFEISGSFAQWDGGRLWIG